MPRIGNLIKPRNPNNTSQLHKAMKLESRPIIQTLEGVTRLQPDQTQVGQQQVELKHNN